MRRTVVALWCAIAVTFTFGACRQLVGIDDRAPETETPDAAGDAVQDTVPLASLACGQLVGFADTDDDSCRACLAASCCGEIQTCNGDADCSAASGCTATCASSNDPDCASGCSAAHPDGAALLHATLACRVRNCAVACGDAKRCGRPPGPAEACAACLDQACCSAEQALFADPLGRQLHDCSAKCSLTDPSCFDACNFGHPGGWASESVLRACAASSCQNECQVPPGAECGAVYVSTDPCSSCAIDSCCDLLYECNTDPGCVALYDCLGKCGFSKSCIDACNAKAPVISQARLAARDNCRAHNCTAVCGFNPEIRCGISLFAGPCLDCVNDQCCDVAYAAASDPNAVAASICQAGCTTSDCMSDCAKMYPTANSLGSALSCMQSKCTDLCFPSPDGGAG